MANRILKLYFPVTHQINQIKSIKSKSIHGSVKKQFSVQAECGNKTHLVNGAKLVP